MEQTNQTEQEIPKKSRLKVILSIILALAVLAAIGTGVWVRMDSTEVNSVTIPVTEIEDTIVPDTTE